MSDQPLISTPDYLRTRAHDLHVWVLSLNDDMARQKDAGRIASDAPQLQAWRAWRARWSDWYGKTDGATWLWGATGETLDEYAAGLNKWREWYQRAFSAPPSMVPGAANPDEKTSGVPKWLLFAGIFGGGFVLWRALR